MPKILNRLAHLPTFLLAVGFPVYWLELYVLKRSTGQTTWLAAVVWVLCSVYYLFFYPQKESEELFTTDLKKPVFERWKLFDVALYSIGGFSALVIFIVAFKAWLLPPHLIQESDALIYHIMIPRQHLIMGSFKHITWTVADLFLLPIEFSLAPFWLVTALPNKFPQCLFFVGLVFILMDLTGALTQGRRKNIFLVGLAVFGSHHVAIQLGTAMQDLIICYLFFAAWHSFLRGQLVLCALELTFFVWSKSFIPIQMGLVIMVMVVLYFIFRKIDGGTLRWGFFDRVNFTTWRQYQERFKKGGLLFMIFSALIAGPFLIKSTYYCGSPFYPLAVGTVKINPEVGSASEHWQSIQRNADYMVNDVKDVYGYGRGPVAFLKHFWLMAVPTEGVNNKYDYPLGLVYLLVLGPFMIWLIFTLKQKDFAIMPVFLVGYWLTWWLGSHQSRFLYIPVLLMVVLVFSRIRKPGRILATCVVIAVLSSALSVIRVHKRDWGKTRMDVLRPKDRLLVDMNQEYLRNPAGTVVELDRHDVTFARFPVHVAREHFPLTVASSDEPTK